MCNEFQSKLPPDYKIDDVRADIKKLSSGGKSKQIPPLNICLQQEVDRLQKVLSTLRKALSNMKLAIAGTIVMSAELATTLDALYMARVPPLWTKVSDLVLPNMGVWFASILLRAEQLTSWLKTGRPLSFWLTGLFNAQGFLTANRQEVCRKHDGWALDDVVNYTEVMKHEKDELKKPPDEGIYIHGLFLDGCRWDKGSFKLVDSEPKKLYAPLPVLLVTGVLASEKSGKGDNYECPVYRNPKRTGLNFIVSVDLRTEDAASHWIRRGVCLLCSKE